MIRGRLRRRRELLPDSLSVRECVAFWLKRHSHNLTKKAVAEVVAELIKNKSDAGKSDVYIKDIACRLNAFAKDFQVPIFSAPARRLKRGFGIW